MDPILEHVQRLAQAIADDPRTTALKDANERLKDAPEDAELQQRYHAVRERIHELEQQQRPVEPDLKREAAALAERVRRSAVLQGLLRAHAEFGGMMDTVSTTIQEAVDRALGAEGDVTG
jgi:cell fate (sporulation/competence/biofilm development) regulator YlbF (YheA/YmcA/DUF963 family)